MIRGEPTALTWLLRAAIGPAMILDGICGTLTLGTWAPGLAVCVARRLAWERFRHLSDMEAGEMK